jgi:hypothetical protein
LKHVYARYEDGVFSFGNDPALLEVSLISVAKWIRRASGCYTYKVWNLGAVPEAYRDQIIAEVRSQALPALQQRDGEDETNAARRTADGLAMLRLVESLFNELDTVTVWSNWPLVGQSRFQLRAEVVAKKNSWLAGVMGRLGALQPPRTDESVKAMFTCRVGMAFPSEVRSTALYAINFLPSTMLRDGLHAAIGSGAVGLDSTLVEGEGGAEIQGDITYEGIRLPQVPKSVKAITTNDELTVPIDQFPLFSKFEGYSLSSSLEGNTMSFRLGKGATSSRRPSLERPSPLARRSDIARLDLDLSVDADKGRKLIAIIQRLEEVADDLTFAEYRKRVAKSISGLTSAQKEAFLVQRPEFRVGTEPPNPFRSLSGKLSSDGDLRLSARVTATPGRLTARLTMGRDLHRLFLARRLVTGARLKPRSGQ